MTSLIIQLHAAPEELAAFVGNVAKTHNMHAVLFRFLPTFSCEIVSDLNALADVMDLKDGQQVVLLLQEPDLNASNQMRFYDHNPNFISFHFGHWSARGLGQSSMGFKTDDEATIAVGKKISKQLKKITLAGVRVTNPKTGESSIAKTFRYTEGALRLEREGVQMLPNGGNLIKLGVD